MRKTPEQNREYYYKNREKILAQAKIWAKANPDKRKKNQTDWIQNNPEKRLWHSAKRRSHLRGIPFDLLPTDIVIPKYCPYLGVELTHEQGKGKLPTQPSLDRIDPTKGYTKDNIQVISFLANAMKQNASEEQLRIFAQNVLRIHDVGSSRRNAVGVEGPTLAF